MTFCMFINLNMTLSVLLFLSLHIFDILYISFSCFLLSSLPQHCPCFSPRFPLERGFFTSIPRTFLRDGVNAALATDSDSRMTAGYRHTRTLSNTLTHTDTNTHTHSHRHTHTRPPGSHRNDSPPPPLQNNC